jgi:hypothetical protein
MGRSRLSRQYVLTLDSGGATHSKAFKKKKKIAIFFTSSTQHSKKKKKKFLLPYFGKLPLSTLKKILTAPSI